MVGVGRIVPGVRTYVSVPAGLSHMPLVPYLLYSALGTVLWTGALAIAGYVLGAQFDRVQQVHCPHQQGGGGLGVVIGFYLLGAQASPAESVLGDR